MPKNSLKTVFIECLDCKTKVLRTGYTQKRCAPCGKIHDAEWFKKPKNRAARAKREREWRKKPENKIINRKRQVKWRKKNIERLTVQSHYYWIFNPKHVNYKYYKDMPFFDGWNPDKSGSFQAGADWIIENLGKRPKGKVSLDVIDHILGFVPGNLRWSDPKGQNKNQMYKKNAQLRRDLEKAESEISKLKLIISKLESKNLGATHGKS
jgi:hypothetical protein